MAKESVKARDRKRRVMVEKFRDRREKLKKDGDWIALDKLPRNSSKTRLRNRCQLTGRGRGLVGLFGLSRIKFREMALYGKIPGIKKASW